jgi:hypothetical protein
MQGFYGGLQVAVAMTATSLIPSVLFHPVAPGWYDVSERPEPLPDWAKLPVVPMPPGPCFALDPAGPTSAEGEDDLSTARPCAAPSFGSVRPPCRARR